LAQTKKALSRPFYITANFLAGFSHSFARILSAVEQRKHFSECLIQSAEECAPERLRAKVDDFHIASFPLAGRFHR
jgi:hypothetical protein